MSTSEIAKLESRWRDNPQGLTFAPLAEAYRKQRDPRRALEILQPGLERHPDYIPANIVLGRCHWDLGDMEAAEKAFTRVLTLDGENVIALKALADITERQSRPHEAERWLETLLSVDRSNDEARDQLARIRAVQRVSPAMETPSGLDLPPAAELEAPQPMPADMGPALQDPFPSIADQMPLAEPETLEPAAARASAAEDAALEPAAFPDLANPVELAEPSRSEYEPEAAAEPTRFAPAPGSDAFGFERAEEIVLNVSSGSEFQVPSAADDLIASRRDASDAALHEGRDDAAEVPGFHSEEMVLRHEAEVEPEASVSSLSSDPPEPAALFASYSPAETAAYEPPASEPPPYEAPYETPAAELLPAGEPSVPFSTVQPEPVLHMEPPAFSTAPRVSTGSETDAPDTAEPDLVVTETMAQVFLRQGYVVEALAVYRELLARTPDSGRYQERVAELQERQRVLAAPPQRPSFHVRDTGGQSLGSFFATLLAARLDHVAPVPGDELGGVELSPETAPATRPAQEPLSLGSVFGEDPPAAAPAVPPAGSTAVEPPLPAGTDAVSFDDFFAGAPVPTPAPAPAARPSRAKPDDDLDQFHTWLQGLKR
jgi:tetratricopeptide (TPR) repeat protein